MENKKLKDSQGIALAVTLLILMILSVLFLTIGTLGISNLNLVSNFRDSTAAYYAARAGVARAIYELYDDSSWAEGFSNQSLTSVNGTYTVSFSSSTYYSTNNMSGSSTVTGWGGTQVPSGYAYVISTGIVNNATQRVASMVKKGRGIWDYALFGDESLSLNGTIDIDGNIGTNDDEISESGNPAVDGEKDTDAGITLDPVTEPTITPDNSGTNFTSTASPAPGKYGYVKLSGGDTLTLSAGNYSFTGTNSKSAINVGGGSSIIISSGPVYIYVNGELKLAGNAITNNTGDASKLIFYGVNASSHSYENCTSVTITGCSGAVCAIYAPNADITFSGTCGLTGSAIGNVAFAGGTTSITYDSNLATLNTSRSRPSVTAWGNVY